MSRCLNILLVQPTWDGLGYRRKIKVDERAIHPLALGVVAALSGAHEVRIVDEAREAPPASAKGLDVVGISVNTFNAPRAYRLADRFRAERVPVVLGGPHTALLPDECLQHADSIVIGDAEDTWPRVLEDVADGRLQAKYASRLASGDAIPAPRRDLFRHTSRHIAYCQLTRGCTNKCRFCYLQYLPQPAMRLRPAGRVVEELRAMPEEILLFVDDNLFCVPEYAREILRAMAPLRKHWWIQAPTNLHRDAELIPLMARSGCYSVSIGFQTASNLTNEAERIFQNRVEEYGQLVEVLHRHAILVDGTFIFGFGTDDTTTFAATGELIRRLRLDSYTFYFLTPYPGTEYFAEFEREGRILHRDWARFDWDHVVVQPRQMSAEDLARGVEHLTAELDRTYFPASSLRSTALALRRRASLRLLRFLAETGWSYRRAPALRD